MKRVVITGIGIVCPIGVGKEEYWENLTKGKSGISRLTCIDTSSFKNHRGGEIKNLDPSPFLNQDEIEDMERGSIMAVMAAKLAMQDAGIDIGRTDRHKVGVAIGTTMGEIQTIEKIDRIRVKYSEEEIPASLFRNYAPVNIPGNVSKALGINGRSVIIPNACAAGSFNITYSFELIREGIADIMFVGGVDPFSWIAFTGFNRLGAVSHDVVRPFDRDSKGMMVSEGAGILVMESAESAIRREARIYAELVGYGLTCDANHMTAPVPDGMVRAMSLSLDKGKVHPDKIDAVIAHGTGTPANDKAEMAGLFKVFSNRKNEIPVTSIKSMIGHTMGAASAIEAITNALMVSTDIIPPTINYETPHLEMDSKIKIVGNKCLRKKVDYGMNNALAFGGNNSSLIMKKFYRE